MKVSIIIPIYNGANTLRECLDSLKNQTEKNFELILINDGSTDETQEIIDSYLKCFNKIKIINNGLNLGVSHARNLGMNNVSSDYCAFIDCDDIVSSNYVKNICKELSNNPDLIIFSYYLNSKPIYAHKKRKDVIPYKKHTGYGFVWNKVFRYKIILENKINFNEDIHIREDSIFVNEFLNNSKNVSFSKKLIYKYNAKNIDNYVCKIKYFYELEKTLEISKELIRTRKQQKIVDAIIKIYSIRIIKNKDLYLNQNIKYFIDNYNLKIKDFFNFNIPLKYKLYYVLHRRKCNED